MNAAWLVAGVEKVFKRLTIDENVSAIGTWSAVRNVVEDLAAFSEITVEREGIQIFGGRIERPGIDFSRAGSEIRPGGFDYTIKLTDYLTPQSSIVDTATAAALATLLSNTPYTGANLDIIDEFVYITAPTALNETCEFLEFDFSDTCIEFEETGEQITEVDTDINTLPAGPEFRCCFWADTGNRRFFIFYKTGGNLVYRHSSDCGATWSAEAQPVGAPALATAVWSVAWYDSKVYILLEDGAGNTDFWRGTIADVTGIVTVALIAGNIFANPIRAGPIFDNEGHIWCIEETVGNGDVWESINDGVAWINRFTAQEIAKYLLPREADAGDVWVIEHDNINNDLELWYWDASAGAPELFDSKIDDIANVGNVSGAQNADYTIHLAWTDNAVDLFYDWKTEAGLWDGVQTLTGIANMGDHSFQISADRGISAYLFAMSNLGVTCRTIKNGTASAWSGGYSGIGAVENGYVQSPQTGLWDGELAVFVVAIDGDGDLFFVLLDPTGIRIDRGDTTGWFRTDAQTAGGSFIKWGYCVAIGVQLTDTLWSVLDNLNVVLVSGQKVPFDIDLAGVDPVETTIKFLVDMTDTGTDPYIYYINFSERIDELTMELDFEDAYTGMLKWVTLSGGEFWLDGAGVLHVAYRRGSDKSDRVILKNSKTGDYPEVEPNIKVVSRDPDWAPFANAIKVIGAEGAPRIEAEIKDQPSIDEHGEHWYCHRDPDIQTVQMAETVGAIQLVLRNTVIDRIRAVILDEYDPTDISIGDNVWVVAEFGDDVATKLNASMRVVSLTRSWGPDGEQVSLELINLISASEYWAHLVTIADLTRWVTA